VKRVLADSETLTDTAPSSVRVRSLTFAALLHISVVLFMTFGVPWQSKRDIIIPPTITVEIIEVAKKTRTNKPAPISKKVKVEDKKKPPKVAKNTSKVAKSPPRKKPPVPKKKNPKPEPKKIIEPVETAAIKPIIKPPPKKKPPKKTTNTIQPKNDFGSVLRNLADNKKITELNKPDAKTVNQIKSVQAPLAATVTVSELDAFRKQLESCWNVPIGAKGIDDVNIKIRMVVNPDRTLQNAEIVDQGRYRRDSFFRAIADSALRAVYNPKCSPFALPKGKYRAWNVTTMNFNPRDMF